ncbi:Gfo/Idh/MocA family oxidoreductase [Paenibacillus nasutitermitis]|uniref:4,5-dihydroxyphthalate dehydrogenase n=1 Tax=Paenibacillus nasutitermitis TaxID=1652958 RepID=A0A917DYS1_9BACL|nr:Gfo/Idh/MocA family oxidoreductase [Paenibacillus nasutitermitis]GGD82964.1 4,5-dihydroxyphthalate dehydrogenase [Paenibacillus nasutitermitis]
MKKVVLVGAGSRALYMFAKPMAEDWKSHIDFCGIYDTNRIRANLVSVECGGIPVYEDFGAMLKAVHPDTVIVASTDSTHHTYIVASLRAGCDVITEKPMTIDAEKTNEIIEAERASGRKVTVTFNLRFAPYFAKVKELLAGGAIGEIHHVSLEWYLDRSHGADYFRRWHAEMKNSGGLLVHKSTHHFDIVNWWVDAFPADVQAYGSRRFYGPTRAERGVRCLTCDYTDTCEFYLDLSKHPFMETYYHKAESEDGYVRDRCVFDERIDIYDNMSVQVRYNSGALLTYSLVAYSPYEGWRATINGSGGRMELTNIYSNADMRQEEDNRIKIYKPDGTTEDIQVSVSAGGHGGGDAKLHKILFSGVETEDPLGQQAGSYAGAMSLLIGHAANKSIQEGRQVHIADLLPIRTI